MAGDDLSRRILAIVTRVAAQHDVHHAFAPTDHLVDSGLTSMAMVDLMLAIEADFDLAIPPTEMQASNFQSVVTLAAMLKRLDKGPA